MNLISETVDSHFIDSLDTAFKISTNRPADDLIESIKQVGLIAPLILKKKTDRAFTVVSGFRRLHACRCLGWRHVDARIVAENNSLSCLKIAIADNAYNRELNVIEQARAISKLAEVSEDDTSLVRNARDSGLLVNLGLFKKLKTISALHDDLKQEIAEAGISLTIALELEKCDHDAAMLFARMIRSMNPTLNHQKEIIRLTKEIAKRENVQIQEVINNYILPVIQKTDDLDRNQKIKVIRRRLKQRRYPEMIRFETDYTTRLNRLDLPESIRIVPPSDFEGNTYTLNLKFQNSAQFREILTKLNQTADHADFVKIIEKDFEDH